MSDLYDDIVNTTPGSGTDTREKAETFNALVSEFAGVFGVDVETQNVDFRDIIDSPVDPEKGVNEYGLTQSQLDELKIHEENDNVEAARAVLDGISKVNQGGGENLSPGQIAQVTYQLQGAGVNIDESTLAAVLGGVMGDDLDRKYESQQGRMVTEIGPDGKLVPDPENPGAYKQIPFASHFTKQPHFFINNLSSEDDIEEFQRYLIENKAVAPDYFVGTEGKYSLALEQAVVQVMSWFDANQYLSPNSQEYKNIMSGDPIFFTESQYYEWSTRGVPGTADFEESPWAKEFDQNMKLFDHAVREYVKLIGEQFTLQEAKEKEAFIDSLKQNYQVPSPIQRQEEVEDWFMQKLGRKGTKAEITEWANGIAESYASNFQELANNLYGMTEAYKSEQWAQDYLAGRSPIKSWDEMTDISAELAVEDPMLREYEEREEAYETEIDAHQAGARKKELQTMVLRMMLGK